MKTLKKKEKINVENDKYLKELSNKLEEAKIINIIGNIGVTGDYQKLQNIMKTSKSLAMDISFIMLIAVVYLAFTVLKDRTI